MLFVCCLLHIVGFLSYIFCNHFHICTYLFNPNYSQFFLSDLELNFVCFLMITLPSV